MPGEDTSEDLARSEIEKEESRFSVVDPDEFDKHHCIGFEPKNLYERKAFENALLSIIKEKKWTDKPLFDEFPQAQLDDGEPERMLWELWLPKTVETGQMLKKQIVPELNRRFKENMARFPA